MKHLLIIGARGFGREVYAMAKETREYIAGEYDIPGFLDDKADALDDFREDYPPIISSVEQYEPQPNDVFFCALGDSHWRKHYAELIEKKGGRFVSIVHPLALINETASISKGCLISAYSIVSANVSIGRHVILHCFDILGHDARVDDYVSLEAHVFLGGGAKVGELSTLHTKSSIIPHKSVGKECSVGIGSVVMRNFKDGVHVFGNPARITEF